MILLGQIQFHLSYEQEWGIFIARAQYIRKIPIYSSLINCKLWEKKTSTVESGSFGPEIKDLS